MIGTIEKPLVKKSLSILGYLLLYVLFLVSLMPIIAWWAGLIALALLAFQIYLMNKPERLNLKNILPSLKSFSRKRYGRLTFYIIFFGVIIHSACRIHSEILIHKLYVESNAEKKMIVSKIIDE